MYGKAHSLDPDGTSMGILSASGEGRGERRRTAEPIELHDYRLSTLARRPSIGRMLREVQMLPSPVCLAMSPLIAPQPP